jgi:ribonuclease J
MPDSRDELLFVPLGGAGEIGMNLNLYRSGGKWLMVDLGVTFADESLPGIDLVLPDPSFIAEQRDDLVALVLTHAHEDHLGAVPYLWRELRCPIVTTRFTAAVLRRKLQPIGLLGEVEIREVASGDEIDLGPFRVCFIPMTHSIPEAHALAIRTAAGTVIHTGDWKLDPAPLVGGVSDSGLLRRYGSEGVLAMICDSTNIFNEGHSGSESDLRGSLHTLFGRYDRRILVTTFASNLARLRSVAEVAEEHGRSVVLVGRSMRRMIDAAREVGYLDDAPTFLDEREAGELPPENVLFLSTGCQGEPRSALTRIAAGQHPNVSVEKGDVVVFSSRIIPGNEKAIGRVQNQLVQRGVEVVTEEDHFVHVSGHPARNEMAAMYGWIRPRIAVPVHGEARHLMEHAKFAAEMGVAETPLVTNGDILRLAPGPAAVIGEAPAGRLVLDGQTLRSPNGAVLRARRRLMHHGSAFVTLTLDEGGHPLTEPLVSLHGLADAEDEPVVVGDVARAITRAVGQLPGGGRRNDEVVREAARLAIRAALGLGRDQRPIIEVQVARVPVAGTRQRAVA